MDRPSRLAGSTLLATLSSLVLLACSSSGAAPGPGGSDASSAGDSSLSTSDAGTPEDSGSAEDAAPDAVVIMGVDASACPTKPTTGDFPADVAAVLADRCQTCHKMPPINHAPFPLLTYEDTLVADPIAPFAGAPIWEAMSSVIQPGAVPHMPFGNAPQLSDAQYQTLSTWLFSCALPVPAEAGTAGDDAGSSDAAPE